MKSADLDQFRLYYPRWLNTMASVKTVVSCSPSPDEEAVLKTIIPPQAFTTLTRDKWDISSGPAPIKSDLIILSNVFMYSPDPQRWFDNVFASARFVWIQDQILACRDDPNELAQDGDSMRYEMPPDHLARIPGAYDLHRLDDRKIDFVTYSAGGGNYPTLSFLLFLRGDLVL